MPVQMVFLCFTFCCCSVTARSNSLWSHELQHARLPCPSLYPRVCSNSCPLSWWCCLTISSSAALFSFCLQSFPASGSFPMSQLFASGGQSVRVSISASVLTMNIQSWFPLGLTGLTFFQSKGLSRVFPSTIIWRHQFFGAQPSLWSKFYIHTWLLEKPLLWLYGILTSLLFNMLSRFVIAFLSRSKQVYAIGLSIF